MPPHADAIRPYQRFLDFPASMPETIHPARGVYCFRATELRMVCARTREWIMLDAPCRHSLSAAHCLSPAAPVLPWQALLSA